MVSFNIIQGNPGTLTFIADAYNNHNVFIAESAFQRMQDHGIIGDKLYMLWNDCCGRDTDRALVIMLTHPIDEIRYHINYENGHGIPYDERKSEVEINEQ